MAKLNKRTIAWLILCITLFLLLIAVIMFVPSHRDQPNPHEDPALWSAEVIGDRTIQLTIRGQIDGFDAADITVAASTRSWDALDSQLDEVIAITGIETIRNGRNETIVIMQVDTVLNLDGTRRREEYRGMLPMLTAERYYTYDMNTDMVKADRLLTWQTDAGGWDKNLHERPDPKDDKKVMIDRAWDAQESRSLLRDSSGNEAGTLENGATVNEMILLAKVYRETGDRRYKEALLRAIDYLLDMQYPNGGWPLAYPLLGTAADAIAYDGHAMIRAMRVLTMVDQAEYPFDYALVDEAKQARIKEALNKGLDFIMHSQLQSDGQLTGWAKRYDPDTMQPIPSSDGLEASVSLEETLEVVKYLMSAQLPSAEVIAAIDGAVQYIRQAEAGEAKETVERFLSVYETTGYYEDQVFVQVPSTQQDDPDQKTQHELVKVTASRNIQLDQHELKPIEENQHVKQVEDKLIPLSDVQAETIYVVAQDGSGDYTDVQAAIDAVPENNTEPVTIYIKTGLYKQKLLIPKNKPYITFIGESKFQTILTHLEITGTGFNGNSTIIEADDFTAKNLTFANEAGAIGTAAAVEVRGDRGYFEGVRLLGFQDTLYLNAKNFGRFYFRDCYIEGAVDFIYGPGTAFLENCVIFNKRSGGYITAASTPEDQKYGIIFYNCTITGYPWVKDVYFGRPWREFANDVFLHSWIDEGMIALQGWHNWGSTEKEKTARYREYGSYGPGANIRFRAQWVKQLSTDEASEYTLEQVLSGDDGWNPLQ